MAQKSGSSKTARMSVVDTQKKEKREKEDFKLPALASPSPSKRAKDVPVATKLAPAPKGVSKAVKSPPPKSLSKLSTRGTPTKLSAPSKPPPVVKLAPPQLVDGQATESSGPDASAVPIIDVRSGTQTVESSQLVSAEIEDLSISADVESSPEAIAATEATAVAEEAERLQTLQSNGMVMLVYESYDELFPIENGSTTQANIDEVYCLSFVMPNCLVRLSRHPNPERFQREESGIFDSLVREDPRGTYHDLEQDQTYYVVVEQETDQLRRDQEATKTLWNKELQKQKKEDKDDGRAFESCSCIYGNPCVDEYGCRDWHSRFAVATKNGWKGF
ncbi:hypothetical protein PHYPSEUDO_009549 [Phytophthora pseudosyringae]|uniref:Uncharacterized protein n=1 Tax=Phytophthora pseudosyringae TaxID=221518 RepID=A0A8T1WJD5_9STRA|nr:hypothetical protein PHYPSEUDO_009549 [Phytophthora pseudosyringae]